jgi:hypothetical protein
MEIAMTSYLITVDPNLAHALATAIHALNGQPFTRGSWIAPWSGTADSLCRHLRSQFDSTVIVCSMDTDWSYR